MLRDFEIENIKAFREPARVELAPVTVLLGKNSAGKSALLRFPVMLGHSLAQSKGPSLLLRAESGFGIDYAADLLDMAHFRSPSPVRWRIGLGQADEIDCSLIQDSTTGFQIVEQLALRHDGLVAHWVRTDRPDHTGMATYRYNDQQAYPLRFLAGLPDVRQLPSAEATGLVEWARESFLALKEALFYLGPVRQEPQRRYQSASGSLSIVGPRGEDAAQMMAASTLAQGAAQDILERVGEWFKEHVGQRLVVRRDPGSPEFAVLAQDSQGRSVNLVDIGHGVGQLLPLIVQIERARQSGAAAVNHYFIEQPESQLHPAAHGDVADALLAARSQRPQSRLIIETHSENLLLRLRRRAIEGRLLTHQDLLVYWVEPTSEGSLVRRITFDAQGQPSDWPRGVFAEDYQEVMEIRRALARQGRT